MKLGIMQPYFFPYLGYFSLIKHTEKFILLNEVQFIRHGWIERNRVLKQNEGWIYIKVPLLKDSRESKIKDCLINNNQDWKGKILSQLAIYKKIAPFYSSVLKILEQIFEKEYKNVTELDKIILETVCHYLNIDTSIEIFSEMNLIIDIPTEADEWALNICKSINGVTEYWNPSGGQSFFDKHKYEAARIDLKFQKVNLTYYDQKRESFETGLSIIDVMMFNSVEEINKMLDNYELL